MKLLCGRGPADSEGLASQPTLSRFEHGVSAREVLKEEPPRRLDHQAGAAPVASAGRISPSLFQ